MLAQRLVSDLGSVAVWLPMDGFHLAQAELVRAGLADRKGAPETFDRDGFAATLQRLASHTSSDSPTIYAPAFDRSIEDSVAAAIAVPASVSLVIVEGNYLLNWAEIAELLHEVWFLDPGRQARIPALIQRHVEFGKSLEAAREWVMRSDEPNAEFVDGQRSAADLIITEWPS